MRFNDGHTDRVVLPCPLPMIGTVRTCRTDTESTPIQAGLNRTETGVVDILPPYVEGLLGLDGFDFAWLLCWLHDRDETAPPAPMTQVPFLLRPEQRRMGIFATRGPRRVNPIGLSLVSIDEVSGGQLRFRGVDLVDGTPVLDLKPYVGRFDRPDGEPRCGWFDTVPMLDAVTPADLGRSEWSQTDIG